MQRYACPLRFWVQPSIPQSTRFAVGCHRNGSYVFVVCYGRFVSVASILLVVPVMVVLFATIRMCGDLKLTTTNQGVRFWYDR